MPQVIDLISSSPSPPPRPAPNSIDASDLVHDADPAPAPDGAPRLQGRPRPSSSAAADTLCRTDASDDDDLDPFSPAREAPRKRRRRDYSPVPDLPLSRPPLLAGPEHARVVESIDASSPLASAAVRSLTGTLPSPVAPTGCAVPVTDTLCSDPFATSSPAPPFEPHPRQPTRRAVSHDPILVSSSPVIALSRPHQSTRPGQLSLTREPAAGQVQSQVICIGSDSADGSSGSDLPDVDQIDFTTRPSNRPSSFRRVQSDVVRPSLPSSRPAGARPVKRTASSATAAAAKAAEKERKKREREQEKGARAQEKARAAALTEANKLRTDKKVSAREMIVDLPSALASECRTQLELILQELNIQHTTWDSPELCLVKWRRKVTNRFDEDLGRWEPISPRVHVERNVLVIVTAQEFVDLMQKGELDSHINKVKLPFVTHYQVIYVLQGMMAWMRKNRNIRNRQFASRVRANDQASAGNRQRSADASYVCEDTIEDAILRLQVEHDFFIHHTAAPVETARWVAAFTQHISTVPYRRQKDHATSAAGFCMESGQVKTGEGAADTYVRMLQEMVRVTGPIAYGVAAEFGSVSRLVKGLEEGGPERLSGVKRSANMDGLMSDRAIGQAVSRRLHKVFTGRDEMSTDV
ncbi:hypothetical protein L249_3111 [Ophiocordyceps polyrhachis-furcata BCC 54312]|uniref:ERCC4 domain-containing protein n=1 Tax=Ophiocordyceps polyrhachis-furcata BCC 54312 TaxID=1330021 RepID=A0A367LRX4_9HYPO|nr:hypothetical protein L249_3111 [Ophiocordyceps polyrhachis-furcata BCC 54312]